MTKLQEQVRLAKEFGFKEVVIPIEEAELALSVYIAMKNETLLRGYKGTLSQK